MVQLDPLSALVSDLNNNDLAYDVSSRLGRICCEEGCHILEVAHSRKGGAMDTPETLADEMKGASAWTQSARSVRLVRGMTEDEADRYGIPTSQPRAPGVQADRGRQGQPQRRRGRRVVPP